MMQTILVAIGANLPGLWGTPLETCRRATHALAALPGLRLEAVSRWYRSKPVPASDQPDYINGVARLAGDADPAALLARLQAIEAEAGRVRGVLNAARTLDLDIIDHGGRVRAAPDPVLPHPRAVLRAFVLLPLAELSPTWQDPASGRTVAALLDDLRRRAMGDAALEGCGKPGLPLDWPIPIVS